LCCAASRWPEPGEYTIIGSNQKIRWNINFLHHNFKLGDYLLLGRPDKCARDLAAGYAHPKKQVVSSVVKTKPPQKNRVTMMAQFPEKCRNDSFLHPWREPSADTMKPLWLTSHATYEALIAN
jgi:hypothetical protein